jgi:hypothetical protein
MSNGHMPAPPHDASGHTCITQMMFSLASPSMASSRMRG